MHKLSLFAVFSDMAKLNSCSLLWCHAKRKVLFTMLSHAKRKVLFSMLSLAKITVLFTILSHAKMKVLFTIIIIILLKNKVLFTLLSHAKVLFTMQCMVSSQMSLVQYIVSCQSLVHYAVHGLKSNESCSIHCLMPKSCSLCSAWSQVK